MRATTLLLLFLLAAGGFAFSGFVLHQVGNSIGYAPEQPIAFSHALHAGEKEIPCLYCHFGAEHSRHAGIPPANVCMNCHRELRVQSRDIALLKEAYAQHRPIAWTRVHDLPDFVTFNHARHVRVAGLACQACHGPVETMTRLRQHAPLTMGWCIDCHRELGATILARTPDTDAHDRALGGMDCAKCHY